MSRKPQISAHVEASTSDELDRYVRERGLKKAAVIERALLHHLQVMRDIPEDIVVPPRIVITEAAARRLEERTENPQPTEALRRLLAGS